MNSITSNSILSRSLRFSLFANTRLTTNTKSHYLDFSSKRNTSTLKNVKAPRVLITGGLGQLGMAFARNLRAIYGSDNVILSDIKQPSDDVRSLGPYIYLDILNYALMEKAVEECRIDWVIHLSAVLSALGEKNPKLALDVNINGFQNILEVSKEHNLRLLTPSTMGVFSVHSGKTNTPDFAVMRPDTIYGISKIHMELMGEYYNKKYNLDFRSLRYPGIISADSQPGGGTTDYAVDIFHSAIKTNSYSCFLKKDTSLAMMYLDDCIEGTLKLLTAPEESLKQRVYNINAITFSPEELAQEIKKQWSPDFKIEYKPDFRQHIADTWPNSLDDSNARRDWNFDPKIRSTEQLVSIMLSKLNKN
ncbi:hypothetical protein BB559_007164 [Furculomyces boomerangus]|uniref:L-threonine 3-dehydrogenase, mitochondrial n=1 Tax=Furculomyces boomerangus TaxID=61424 RepID=A0A2T9XYJ3_9FUNG|nr:hypothetical protein BB559_007164 [Furculomyces boomerangus]